MPRYRVIVEYDGTPFVGWQIQAHGVTVQGRLTQAIRTFSAETTSVRGAGRTDAGVHALGQVAHFDLMREWPADTVRAAVHFHLKPDPIAVIDCAVAPPSFDARFCALARHYRYRILSRRAPPVLDRDRVWWVPHHLAVQPMAEAARLFMGKHDFSTFRAAGCQARSPIKTLDSLLVTATDDEIRIEASARSFLHNQVRSMVGALKIVGEGKWSRRDVENALAARNRASCPAVAPARGLYLVKVDYRPSDLLKSEALLSETATTREDS
jgi:tRNA pseudouridine38-40 synthase